MPTVKKDNKLKKKESEDMRTRKAKATDLTWEEKNPAVYGKTLSINEDLLKELKAETATKKKKETEK